LKPKATVLITAYNRKQFILDAVRSALNQTAAHDEYEIIVVKNYVENSIDEFLSSNNILKVYSDKENQVTFTLDGLRLARGEIIIFLEDDDRFLPTKIERVISRFNQRPSLIYLHNNFKEIDESGKTRSRHILKQASKEILIDTSNLKQRTTPALFQYFAFYNTSCISLRREPFMELLSKYPDLNESPTDLHFYFISLLSGYEIMFSNALLNEYRVHFDSRTFGNFEITNSKIEEMERYRKLYLELATKYVSTFGFPLLMSQVLELTFQEYVIDSARFKPKFRDLLAFSYYSFKRRNRVYLLLVILRYFHLFSHKTLLRLIATRRKIRLNRD